MRHPGKVLKAEKWWNDKAPPTLAAAYFLLATSDPVPPLGQAALAMAAFVAAFVGVAGFGHVVNDLFDIEADRIAGKRNAVAGRAPVQVAALLLALLALAGLPWLVLPANPWNLLFLLVQLALLTAYAVPPLRLKERSVGGVVADALYAYTVPVLITWFTWGAMAPRAPQPSVFAALVAWTALAGLRSILNHQYGDWADDVAAGMTTFATRYGRARTLLILSAWVLPAEAAACALTVVALSVPLPFLPAAVAAWALWRSFQLPWLWGVPLDWPWRLPRERAVALFGYQYLGDLLTDWLPVFTLAALCARAPAFAVFAAAHLLLFRTGLHAAAREARHVPGAVRRMRRRNAQERNAQERNAQKRNV